MAGLISRIFGGVPTDAVSAVGNALDKIFTSDDERLAAQAVLEKLRQQPGILQAEINKIEAGHTSVFVAGWRPFIGWVCGFGFLWAFIGHPMFEWVVVLEHLNVAAPQIITDNMMELVLALLGLGTLRTYEKTQGVAR